MKFALLLAAALASASGAFAADAPDEGRAAVEALGRINGQSLACQQPALGSRARNAVITGTPKTRNYGEIFETATNAAFLAQGKGGICPDALTLKAQLEAAETKLQAAFPPAK